MVREGKAAVGEEGVGVGSGDGVPVSQAEAAEAARAVLSNATISDIVERENRDAGATMYYI